MVWQLTVAFAAFAVKNIDKNMPKTKAIRIILLLRTNS